MTCNFTCSLLSGWPGRYQALAWWASSTCVLITSHYGHSVACDLLKQSLSFRDLTTEPNRRSVLGVRPAQQDREGRTRRVVPNACACRVRHDPQGERTGCDRGKASTAMSATTIRA